MPSLLQIGFYIIQNQLRCGTVCIFQLRCDHTMPFWKYAGDLQHKHAQVTEILQVSYRQDEVCVLLFQTITQTPVLIASLQSPKPLCNHSSTCLNIESIFPKAMWKVSLCFPLLFFPSILQRVMGEKWRGKQGRRATFFFFFLSLLPSFIPLPTICSNTTPKKKPFFSLLAKQSLSIKEIHVSSLISVDCQPSQKIIWKPFTKANKAARLDMCIGTKRVQTCYLNCHKFFLKVRFILTQLYKTRRSQTCHLYSHPR